jgi:hypothetical protein
MGGWVKCEDDHRSDMPLHQAAIRLSEKRLGKCSRTKCKKALHYYETFKFANVKGEENTYEVLRVARLDRPRPKHGYDPFLLLLQHEDNPEDLKILPKFWAPDTKGGVRGGQFPPLLSRSDWQQLFRKLNVKI